MTLRHFIKKPISIEELARELKQKLNEDYEVTFHINNSQIGVLNYQFEKVRISRSAFNALSSMEADYLHSSE
jgi:F0F1-type ATP synthase delta subunit